MLIKRIKEFSLFINLFIFLISSFIWGVTTFTAESMTINETPISFKFDLTKIIISVVAASVAIALLGLNVLSSGFSDESIAILKHVLSYYLVWAILSIYTYQIFNMFKIGTFIYWILTFLYGISIFIEERGGSE